MSVSVLPPCMNMCFVPARCPQKLEEGAGRPGTGVTVVVNLCVGAEN